jgi:hypothetical protein
MGVEHYAGIGSRETPDFFLGVMEGLAEKLRGDEFVLRSGHAPGADQAFEKGAAGQAEIFLPWPNFEAPLLAIGKTLEKPTDRAYDMAKHYHPAWYRLSRGGRMLHARNCHIMLGETLDDPVEFVVCWTPNGEMKGGTAQALRIAVDMDIPIHNLAIDGQWQAVLERCR